MLFNTTKQFSINTANSADSDVIVLIPNYNGKHLLQKCLSSLHNQTYHNFKVLVVDDGSTTDDVIWLRKNFPAVTVLALPKNQGFAKAVNAGFTYACKTWHPTFIAVLNNDTQVTENWLSALIARAKTDSQIAAVTSNMFFANHPNILNSQGGEIAWNGDGSDVNFGVRRELGYQKARDVLGACFGAALVRRDAWEVVGPLDEVFYAYFEDLDWSWRARLFGYRIVFEPQAIVYHQGSASFGKNNYRKLFLTKRNALRCAIKNYERKNLGKRLHDIFLGDWFYFIGYVFEQSGADNFSWFKRLRYALIPLWAIIWNICHLPSALLDRRQIQKKRRTTDEEIGVLPRLDNKTEFNNHTLNARALAVFFRFISEKEAATSREAALVRAAEFFIIGTVGYWKPETPPTENLENLAGLDWNRVITLATETNAASPLFFYLRVLESLGNKETKTLIREIIPRIASVGSRAQNFFLTRINIQKYLQGKRDIWTRLYAAAYLEPTLLHHITALAHAWYNYLTRGKKSTTTTETHHTLPFGVNLFGFLTSESGVGEAARSLARSLQTTELPFTLLNSDANPHRQMDTSFARFFSKENPYRINVIAVYGDVFEDVLNRLGRQKFRNRYNIAYWAWELDTLPESWRALRHTIDEVWVPSTFVRDTVVKACIEPVTIVPHAITVGKKPYQRQHFNLPKDEFIFLFMFDFYSIFERKNPLAVIQAFTMAFHKNENARLVIKCSNADIDIENFNKLQSAAQGAKITIINQYLDKEKVESLINVADCYVSLHRSEGFGLTIAEAMAVGKPVIATNYSGNVDFMNEENSFPVNFKLRKLDKDYGPYKKGGMWAEPDIQNAAELMRLVFENEEVRRRRSLKAKEFIATHLNPKIVGETIKNRLQKIEGTL